MCPEGLEMIWERGGRRNIGPESSVVRERTLWLQKADESKGRGGTVRSIPLWPYTCSPVGSPSSSAKRAHTTSGKRSWARWKRASRSDCQATVDLRVASCRGFDIMKKERKREKGYRTNGRSGFIPRARLDLVLVHGSACGYVGHVSV